MWVKKTGYDRILVGPGHYVLHSSEICLIGVKNTKGRRAQYIPKVSNDVIFAAIRKRSQKPEQMYEIIERMVPGGRKVEIFGRNHCIRPSWLTIGNQYVPAQAHTAQPLCSRSDPSSIIHLNLFRLRQAWRVLRLGP